jgi:long-chain fatty acid transport protein
VGVEYLVPAGGAARAVHGQEGKRPLVEVPLRAGYVYERSPVPPQLGETNFVDADRHTLSLGAGVTLNAPFALLPGSIHWDVHGELSILPERVTKKQNPADFIGDYRASGSMAGLGTTLSGAF